MSAAERTAPVGVFDSGVGGISVLREMTALLPHERFVYYGDQLHAPYGVKPQEEVCRLAQDAVRFLLEQGSKAVVIACNTATAAAAETLRAAYAFPVIGMEPAVKPASMLRGDGIVLAMATPGTLGSEKYRRLMSRFGDGVVNLPCPGLMEWVERGTVRQAELEEYLDRLLEPFRTRKVDAVVLGCTHYVFLRRRIAARFPEGTPVIDGNEGTARQLRRKLEEFGLLAPEDAEGGVRIFSSAGEEARRYMERLYARGWEEGGE